ncbi:MAG: InlB B-repeat-containing protein [Alphaproteobacteria bacterium]|nr:InlB B-repeat-containing protein [Alphaproteobacteria bacterium]
MRKFLGFLTFFIGMIFAANSFAAGYVCDDLMKYMSCNVGYYLSDCRAPYDGHTLSEDDLTTGNSCLPCSALGNDYSCAGGNACPVSASGNITCDSGLYILGTECTTCDRGYYCPGGSFEPNGSEQGHYKCPDSHPNSDRNTTAIDYCYKQCESQTGYDYYNAKDTCSNNTGSYVCDDLIKYISCNSGYYLSDCGTTYDGRELNENDLTTGNSCLPCSNAGSGSVCNGELKCPQDDSIDCTAGEYLNGATCESCEPGYYCPGGAWTPNGGKQGMEPCPLSHPNSSDGEEDINYCYTLCPELNGYTLTDGYDYYEVDDTCDYTANTYTVSFNANGGFGGQSTSVTATFDKAMPAISTTAPTRTGYTFMGWYDNADYNAGEKYYTAAGESARKWDKTEETTLYAGWKAGCFAITLDSNGGTGGENVPGVLYKKYDENAIYSDSSCTTEYTEDSVLLNVTRDGYQFAGWSGSDNKNDITADKTVNPIWWSGSTVLLGASTINAEMTIYAVWAKECTTPQNGTCSLNINHSAINTATVTYDAECEEGYTLTDDGTAQPSCTNTEKYYTISYILDGGTINEEYTKKCNEKSNVITLPTDVTREGHTFDGWYDSDDNRVTEIAAGTCNANLSFTAKWQEIVSEESVVINFDFSQTADGAKVGNGELPQQIECIKEQTCSLPQIENVQLYRDGYTFVGWCNEKIADFKGTDYIEYLDKGVFDADTTLYPVWQKNTEIDSYDILLDKNGGEFKDTWDINQCNVNSDTIILPTDMIRIGYVFDGWYRNDERVSTIDAGTCTASMSFVAQWTPCNYTVAFSANGGNGSMDSTTHTYDESQSLTPNKFTRDGYTFVGWNTLTNGTGVSYSNGASVKNLTSTCSGTVTLYAMWRPEEYSITYALSGGTNYSGAPVAYDITTPTITLGTPTRANSVFEGWYTDAAFTTKITEIAMGSTGDKTLYAKWSCNNGYHADNNTCVGNVIKLVWNNGGVGVAPTSPASCTYGQSVTMPAAIVADGYVFNNWTVNNNSFNAMESVICNSGNLGVTSGTATIVAMWGRNQYTVTYSCGSGTGTPPEKAVAKYNQNFAVANNTCSRDGYTFSGWGVSETNDIKTANTTFNWSYVSDKTLTAQWTPCEYTVAFNANGGNGNMDSTTHTYDKSQSLTPNKFTRDGYTFVGWNTMADGTGVSYSNGVSVKNLTSTCSGTVTLYAVWARGQYKINYELYGGTNYSGAPMAYDITTPTITLGTPTRANSVFEGWYTNTSFVTKITEIAMGSTGDKTLYAKWSCMPGYNMNSSGTGCNRADPSIINIVWQNGGHGLTYIPSSTCLYGGQIFMPIEPYAPGYTFVGWSVNGQIFDQNQKLPCDMDTFGVKDGRVVATALWRPETYTISYNMDGGINPTSNPETYTTETPTITLTNPTKDGYVFKYWTNSVGKVIDKIESGSVGDVALKANWAIGTYKITYKLNGGVNNTSNPDAYVFNKTPIVLKQPKRVGYTFDKWVGNYVVDNTIINSAAGDLEIVATWKPNIYTINLNKNNGYGNVVSSVKCTYDSGICELPSLGALKRDGYVSTNKWCEKANGTGKCYDAGTNIDTNISETGTNITLYAVWEPDVFKVELIAVDTAVSTPQTVYLKYATGWFKDSAARTPIALIDTNALPERPGYEFAGYEHDGVMIVDANGELQLDSDSLEFTVYDTAATVIWEKSELKCAPGTEPDDKEEYCVPCQNRFDALGNVAVSSWTKGCTIASCMYHGELYDLYDNECIQVCPYDTYTDETGTMVWNDKTKKCERKCIEGFVRW